jgi:hypothetical protein
LYLAKYRIIMRARVALRPSYSSKKQKCNLLSVTQVCCIMLWTKLGYLLCVSERECNTLIRGIIRMQWSLR